MSKSLKDITGDGKLLYEYLRAERISVESVCEKLEIVKQTLYNYYRLEKHKDELKQEIAVGLGVSIDDIYGLKSKKLPEGRTFMALVRKKLQEAKDLVVENGDFTKDYERYEKAMQRLNEAELEIIKAFFNPQPDDKEK